MLEVTNKVKIESSYGTDPREGVFRVTINDKIFIEVHSYFDQWGTWYYCEQSQETTIAQEWETPSVLKEVGSALIAFADKWEPAFP